MFNLILGGLLGVILVVGSWRDGLFGGVIIANTLIGIGQEVRAKRTLDRLALLVAPRARVWRAGGYQDLRTEDLAPGDLVRLEPGDQVVADGHVVEARELSIDESILTGESEPVRKTPGDEIRSGAYCVAGSGELVVEAVGVDSFAERLGADARGTRGQLSPLQLDINRILRVTVVAMLPLAAALVGALVLRIAQHFDLFGRGLVRPGAGDELCFFRSQPWIVAGEPRRQCVQGIVGAETLFFCQFT